MNQNLIDNENLQNDRQKLQNTKLPSRKDKCYSLNDCEMKENVLCNLYGPCPSLKKQKTNGDVIRESNESLAESLANPSCSFCLYYKIEEECRESGCNNGILAYLNQPIESEVNNG